MKNFWKHFLFFTTFPTLWIYCNGNDSQCQDYKRRNISNLRYADDTTLMAESVEELKSLLMKVKVESEKLA